MKIYQPQSISLPDESKVFRDTSGLASRTGLDPDQYDRYTIFHDVFLERGNRTLVAIGPPLFNLAGVLLPMSVVAHVPERPDRFNLRYKKTETPRYTEYEFALPLPMRITTTLTVEFRFGNGMTRRLSVRSFDHSPSSLALGTLQKDNETAWILDWIRYHARQGVDLVVLYDNGSRDTDRLTKSLKKLQGQVRVLLVAWHFKFGSPANFHDHFGGAAARIHFVRLFGGEAWSMFLDIDEYLVARGETSLTRYLARQADRCGAILVDSYSVPDLTTREHGAVATVRDFPYRDQRPRQRSRKWIVRAGCAIAIKTHSVTLNHAYVAFFPPTSEVYFLHYLAITTNWKSSHWRNRLERVSYDPNRHTEDRSVIEILKSMDDKRWQ